MSGYSSTPLARKLGIADGHRVVVLSAPKDFGELLRPLPEDVRIVRRVDRFNVAVAFVTSSAGVRERLSKLEPLLESGARLWLCWPKKTSGVRTDCTFEVVQHAGLDLGIVDTKVCAIDETWSALCFMRRKQHRAR